MKKILLLFIFYSISFGQFTPQTPDSLLCWYKGGVGYTVAAGDTITKWKDFANPTTAANDMVVSGTDQRPTLIKPDSASFHGNGSDSQLKVRSSSTLSVVDQTISMVVRTKFVSNASYEGVFGKSTTATTCQYMFVKDNLSSISFRIDGVVEALATTTLTGSWHTVVGTYDGTWIKIYVDDVACEDSTAHTGSIDFRDSALKFGVISTDLNDFSGDISDGLIYDDVLTKAEITNIMAYDFTADDGSAYYIDADKGNDAQGGRVMWNAVASFDSINTAGITLVAGDTVYLRTDDTWSETLTVPSSGTSGNVITFTKYDSTGESGSNPTVTQIDVNNKNYITVSNCITATNGIINTGTGYLLTGTCGSYEVRFPRFIDFTKFPRR